MTDEHQFSPDAQRFLDGEARKSPSTPERDDALLLQRAVSAYANAIERPGPAVDDVVMEQVLRSAARAGRSAIWRWFTGPQEFHIRPALAAAAVLVIAVVVWLPTGSDDPAPTVAPVPPAAAMRSTEGSLVALPDSPRQTALVRFQLQAVLASSVTLLGTFNRWERPGIPLTRTGTDGTWTATIPVPLGEQRYGFLVNGSTWTPDRAAHAQADDGFGRTSSILVVGPRGIAR
ncbi:MAG TPA: isoamylase early set domain-containing protein [Gemmatimonadales bacterium]